MNHQGLMMLQRIVLCLLCLPFWASAQILTIDGRPIASGIAPKLFVYEAGFKPHGYTGDFASTIAGKCKELPTGYTPGYVWVSITKSETHARRLGTSQIRCQSDGTFSGTIEGAIDTFTLSLTGETSANLIIELCAFFCQAEPPMKITLRSLDVSAAGQISGTSQNRILDFQFRPGNELLANTGDTNVYLLALFNGTFYVIKTAGPASCNAPYRVRWYSNAGSVCYSYSLSTFSPSDDLRFAYWPSGTQQGELNSEFYVGPLTGLSGMIFIAGFGKNINEVVENHQWTVISTVY